MKKIISLWFHLFQITYNFLIIILEKFFQKQKNRFKNIPVDIVYLRVDWGDPEWLAKKNKHIWININNEEEKKDNDHVIRYEQIDELKYSLRSLEKYANWLRNIYIVTDNQVPKRLNTENPRIKIIDHKDIFEEKNLPCFNSCAIELQTHKIKWISKYYLYANDDMFFWNKVYKSNFLSKRWIKIFPNITSRLITKNMINWIHAYEQLWINIYKFLHKELWRKKRPLIVHHHQIKVIDKNVMNIIKIRYKKIYNSMTKEIFRSGVWLHAPGRNNLYALHLKKAKKWIISQVYLSIEFCFGIIEKTNLFMIKYLKPKLFCINNWWSEKTKKYIQNFLLDIFPKKSSFEK